MKKAKCENMEKENEYKYIVIYKNAGMMQSQGSVRFKTIEEVEGFITKGNVVILYIGEFKPLKIKLHEENKTLKKSTDDLNKTLENMIKINAELGIKLHDKEEKLKQKDSIIEEAIKFINKHRYQSSPLGFELGLNPSQLWQLQSILNKYKGDGTND